jgi:hypothetical protein
MRFWRAHMSAVAVALLVAMAALGVPHAADPGHDAEFAALPVAHDAAAHRVTTPGTPGGAHPLHCLACHWARAFRPAIEAAYAASPAADIHARRQADVPSASHAVPVSQPPLRSPPILFPPLA